MAIDATAQRRSEYIAGLRALARALEQNPDLMLPYTGDGANLLIIPLGEDEQHKQLAAWTRAMPGAKQKSASHDGKQFYLAGRLRGLSIEVICDRNVVCERVVTGTREVTKTVPDPEALAAVPTVEVTEVVEDVEWRCGSVLADRTPAEADA